MAPSDLGWEVPVARLCEARALDPRAEEEALRPHPPTRSAGTEVTCVGTKGLRSTTKSPTRGERTCNLCGDICIMSRSLGKAVGPELRLVPRQPGGQRSCCCVRPQTPWVTPAGCASRAGHGDAAFACRWFSSRERETGSRCACGHPGPLSTGTVAGRTLCVRVVCFPTRSRFPGLHGVRRVLGCACISRRSSGHEAGHAGRRPAPSGADASTWAVAAPEFRAQGFRPGGEAWPAASGPSPRPGANQV